MSTIIYSRISSPNQAEFNGQHFSIENQISKCMEYCHDNCLLVMDTVSEVVSARNINMQKQLVEIYNKYSNCNIVVYNITRFSRNTQHALDFVTKCKEKNINLHFVEENLQLNHFTDMHRLRLGLSQAELESNQTSYRVKSNNMLLKSKGWVFGQAPYGYEAYKKRGVRKLKINKREKAITQFIVNAKGGVSCKTLNKDLNRIIPNNTIPIEYYDADETTKIDNFSKPNMLTFVEIADLLNDYNIKNRDRDWNSTMISRIYKNIVNPNKINFNSLNL